MSKPSLPSFDAANTIEDLNTALDTLASKFDAALDDSDISSVSYSKLVLGGNITNTDIANSAEIVGTKLADDTIPAVKLNNSIINYAKLASGAATKLQGQAGTVGLSAGLNATDTALATLSVTGPEANTKILCFGWGRFTRTNQKGEVILGIDINGTVFTPRPTIWMNSDIIASGFVAAHGTVGTSPIDVKLMAKGDGVVLFSHTSGEAYLIVLMLKRAD